MKSSRYITKSVVRKVIGVSTSRFNGTLFVREIHTSPGRVNKSVSMPFHDDYYRSQPL